MPYILLNELLNLSSSKEPYKVCNCIGQSCNDPKCPLSGAAYKKYKALSDSLPIKNNGINILG